MAVVMQQRRRLRLSPNEEARVIKEETEKRRKLRLQQVRELSKVNSSKILAAVKQEKKKQIAALASQLQRNFEEEREEKLRNLEETYENNLKSIGDGHQEAVFQEPNIEERNLIRQENEKKAEERHQAALNKLRHQKEEEFLEATKHIMARQTALEIERDRSAKIAALPLPPPDPLISIAVPKVAPVKVTDVDAFSSTHFHMAEDYAVERAQPEEQMDAKAAAEEEQERLEQWQHEEKVAAHERVEKARLRHNHARQKELLKQDYDKILLDLSDLQRADRHRRQQVVHNIPKQIFVPPHRRLEEKADTQNFMERAFEDMYMAATDFAGDLSLALDPHPPPDTPAASDVLELSVLDQEGGSNLQEDTINVTHRQAPVPQPAQLRDVTNVSHVADVSLPKPLLSKHNESHSALSKLMGRIKAQRESWMTRTSQTGDQDANQSRMHTVQSRAEVNSAPSLTQYTIDSEDITKGHQGNAVSAPSTLEQGSVTATTASTTDQEQAAEHQTGSKTLLHPMEEAARMRHIPVHAASDAAMSLMEARKRNEQQKQENERHQEELEKQKKDVEKKILEIEHRRKLIESNMAKSRASEKHLEHGHGVEAHAMSSNQPVVMREGTNLNHEQPFIHPAPHDMHHYGYHQSQAPSHSNLPRMQQVEMSGRPYMELHSQPAGYQPPPYSHVAHVVAPPGGQSYPSIAPGTHLHPDAAAPPSGQSYPSLAPSTHLPPDRLAKVREYQQRLLHSGSDLSTSSDLQQTNLEKRTADLIQEYHTLKSRSVTDQTAGYNELEPHRKIQLTHPPEQDSEDYTSSQAGPKYGPLEHSNDRDIHQAMEHVEQSSEKNSPGNLDWEPQQHHYGMVGVTEGIPADTSQPEWEQNYSPEPIRIQEEDHASSNDAEWASRFADFAQRERNEYEALADEERDAFEKRQQDLKVQLEEVRRQKRDLEERQARHQREMEDIKGRWRQELDQYKVYEGQYQGSEASINESDHQVGVEDGNQVAAQSDPTDEELEQELLHRLNEVNVVMGQRERPAGGWLYERNKPPTKQLDTLRAPTHHTHELSPIVEVDTPASDKLPNKYKTKFQHLSTTPIEEESEPGGLKIKVPSAVPEDVVESRSEPKSKRTLHFQEDEESDLEELGAMGGAEYTDPRRRSAESRKPSPGHPLGDSTGPSPLTMHSFRTESLSTGPVSILEESEYHPSVHGIVLGEPEDKTRQNNENIQDELFSPVRNQPFGQSHKTWGLELAEYSLSDQTGIPERQQPLGGSTAQADLQLQSPTVGLDRKDQGDKYTYERLSSTPAGKTQIARSSHNEEQTLEEFRPLQQERTTSSEDIRDIGNVNKSIVSELSQYPIESESTLFQSQVGNRSSVSELSQYPVESDTTLHRSSVGKKYLPSHLHGRLSGESVAEQLSQHTLANETDFSGRLRNEMSALSQHSLPSDSLNPSPAENNRTSLHSLSQYAISPGSSNMDTAVNDSFGVMLKDARQYVNSMKPSRPNPSAHAEAGVGLSSPHDMSSFDPLSWQMNQIRTGTSEELLDSTKSITERIEGAMRKYERIIEESRRTRDEYASQEQQRFSIPDHPPNQSSPTSRTLQSLTEDSTGITEEPDLTLVSVGSAAEDPSTAQGISPSPDKHSLLSFENHELSMNTESETSLVLSTQKPAKHATSGKSSESRGSGQRVHWEAEDRSYRDLYEALREDSTQSEDENKVKAIEIRMRSSGISSSEDNIEFRALRAEEDVNEEGGIAGIPVAQVLDGESGEETSGLTLQEVFMNRRKRFVENSKKRQEEAKMKAKKVESKVKKPPHLSSTLASWKKSRGLNAPTNTNTTDSTNIVERTTEGRKKSEKEMKTRTSRLYGQLEEVKQHKIEEQRKQNYAKNRQKAKEYHQRHQDKLKKKIAKK